MAPQERITETERYQIRITTEMKANVNRIEGCRLSLTGAAISGFIDAAEFPDREVSNAITHRPAPQRRQSRGISCGALKTRSASADGTRFRLLPASRPGRSCT